MKNATKKTGNGTKKQTGSKRQVAIRIPKFRKLTGRRLAIDLILLGCIILLGVSGWLWWSRILMNPDRALSDAIATSLNTRSIVKTVDQSSQGGGIKQVSYLSFYPPVANAQTKTVLTQGIGSNALSVTTETIGTPDADFVRYTAVKGAETLPNADKLNGLLGTWAKREQNLEKGDRLTFLNETLFGIVPFGYLDDGQRDQLMASIDQKDIYKYKKVERVMENNRPVYVYDISLNPQDLVSILREYVTLSGVGDPNQLDPSQYQGLGRINIKLTVDILSRQVTKVEYGTGRVESYSGQNLYKPIDIPANPIPIDELQKRLQQAQTS